MFKLARTLSITNPPTTGHDVAQLQVLLAVVDDGIYGVATGTAVYRKQIELGYKTPTHSAGPAFAEYLTGRAKPTAAMVARAKAHGGTAAGKGSSSNTPPTDHTHEELVRAKGVEVARFLFNHAGALHYPVDDKRVMQIHTVSTMLELELLISRPGGLSIDCSQTVEVVAHVAGAQCPDGDYAAHWAADGYTGTLIDGTDEISVLKAKPLDLRIYGGGTGHHVGIVVEPGPDPLIFGNGMESGPTIVRDSLERRYQPPGGSFRRMPI